MFFLKLPFALSVVFLFQTKLCSVAAFHEKIKNSVLRNYSFELLIDIKSPVEKMLSAEKVPAEKLN